MWDNDITADTRPYIMELQGYLRAIQRERYGTTIVPMDGFYGMDTAAGVRQFQQAEGIADTGVTDRTTWDAVYVVYQEMEQQQAPPTPIQGLRQPILQPGDDGDDVLFLNAMLGLSGTVYTTDTEEAVRTIQQVSFLPITGHTDTATWNAVVALYNRGGERE